MFKIAEIDPSEWRPCPSAKDKGMSVAFVVAILAHGAVALALAFLVFDLGPERPTIVEASFTAEEASEPENSIAAEEIAMRPPRDVPATTELQTPATEHPLRELDPEPAVELPPMPLAAAEFSRDFIPKPKPEAKPQPQTRSIVVNRPPAIQQRRPVTQTSGVRQRPAPKPAFVKAKVSSTARPNYPESARRKGIQGVAQVRLQVNAKGRVDSAKISRSSGNAALDSAAVKAARRWKFRPATSGGKPVGSQVVVPIRFSLK